MNNRTWFEHHDNRPYDKGGKVHGQIYRALRLGGLLAFLLLLCAGSVSMADRVLAAENPYTLTFSLSPKNDEKTYACVGQSFYGSFMTVLRLKESNVPDSLGSLTPPDPLANLTLPTVQVDADPPAVGTLSDNRWTVHSANAVRMWIYTPTKPGVERLVFKARMVDPAGPIVTAEVRFPVINCRYRLWIHSEITNKQGGIDTRMFYDAEGHFDVVKKNKSSPYKIVGYGVTSLLAFSDGKEGDVSCKTTEPGKGSGSLLIDGSGDPSSELILKLSFSDTGTGLAPFCKKEKQSGPGIIPYYGWLPTGKAEGVLADLKFSAYGDDVELGIKAFEDRRWVAGVNSGTMSIKVLPVTGK